ncbi:MAG: glycosyltransferase [Verrucomicrobiota bacterium]
MPLKVLFTIAGLSPRFGGPSYSVPALATAVARSGVETELFTCKPCRGESIPKLPCAELVKAHLLPSSSRSTHWLPQINPFFSALRERASKDCVIHDNGIWLPTNHAAAYAARHFKLPLIISPRGMLTPWAFKQSRYYKFFGWRLYQERNLQSATALHATSRQEAQEFRDLKLKPPIAIIPNGVDLPTFSHAQSSIHHPPSSPRTILFLSRIHPKKGLFNLLRAWGELQKGKAESRKQKVGGAALEWKLVIAGTDEDGHLGELKAESRKLKVEKSIQFVGEIHGEAKWELYRSTDIFVLPSHSENFGIVIAEALASGVPVITTKATPWQELVEHSCGWWIDVGVDPLVAALREAMALTDEQRTAMGARGRDLVETGYSWNSAAEKMKSVYEWVLNQGAEPDCIFR